MHVEHLAKGHKAPKNSSSFAVQKMPGGQFRFTSKHLNGEVISNSNPEGIFDSEVEALAAGINWAQRMKFDQIYIEHPVRQEDLE